MKPLNHLIPSQRLWKFHPPSVENIAQFVWTWHSLVNFTQLAPIGCPLRRDLRRQTFIHSTTKLNFCCVTCASGLAHRGGLMKLSGQAAAVRLSASTSSTVDLILLRLVDTIYG